MQIIILCIIFILSFPLAYILLKIAFYIAIIVEFFGFLGDECSCSYEDPFAISSYIVALIATCFLLIKIGKTVDKSDYLLEKKLSYTLEKCLYVVFGFTSWLVVMYLSWGKLI